MNNDEAVITSLLERLQQQIEALLPPEAVGTVLDQARSTLRQGFADLELVPRHEFEAHLATLEQLRARVAQLEHRIGELETP